MAETNIWRAWAIAHNAHGEHLTDLVFLPDGDKPDTDCEWVRCPWLDSEKEEKE